jgi:hypothetical protein
MSSLPPKADIPQRRLDVCFVPKANSCNCNKKAVAGLYLLRFRPHESAVGAIDHDAE